MGVYTRFKKDPDGFRKLVELLETTPVERRKKMIDVGMREDPEYTEKALQYVLTFEDILNLDKLEVADLMSVAPPKLMGAALRHASPEIQEKFLTNAKPHIASQTQELFEVEIPLRDIGGAQLRIIEVARSLEKKGLIKKKKIPG